MSFAQGACVGVPCATAYYALMYRAKARWSSGVGRIGGTETEGAEEPSLREPQSPRAPGLGQRQVTEGQRVFIHGASGGVGLAAVQIAWLGARGGGGGEGASQLKLLCGQWPPHLV